MFFCRSSILRLDVRYIISWWYLKFKEGCVQELTTKFGSSVKIKSLQELSEEVCGFWHKLMKIMQGCKGLQICIFTNSLTIFSPYWRYCIEDTKNYCKQGVGWNSSSKSFVPYHIRIFANKQLPMINTNYFAPLVHSESKVQ